MSGSQVAGDAGGAQAKARAGDGEVRGGVTWIGATHLMPSGAGGDALFPGAGWLRMLETSSESGDQASSGRGGPGGCSGIS